MMPTGKQTMSSAMTGAHRYHRYTFERIEPFAGNRVVEIGCGWGNYTRMFAEGNRQVLASDIDGELIEHCKQNLALENVTFMQGDIADAQCQEAIARFRPDSVVMMQVLEHIEDDRGLIDAFTELLGGGTRFIICVPAFQALYGPMDSEAGHFRRYTFNSLSKLFRPDQWRIETYFYGNPIGGLGWWVNNRLLKNWTRLESAHVNSQIKIFDKFILPVSIALETVAKKIFGQSLYLVARRIEQRGA